MKRILTIAALAMLGLAAFSGCSKSSSGSSYSMKATVGGTAYSFTNVYAVVTGTNLSITGNNGTSTSTSAAPYMTISLTNYSAPGTYNVDTTLPVPVVSGTWAPDLTMTDWKPTHKGSVTITSYSSASVVGTFNFTCTDGTVISSGSFTARRVN